MSGSGGYELLDGVSVYNPKLKVYSIKYVFIINS